MPHSDYDANAPIVKLAERIAVHLGGGSHGWKVDTERSYPHGATIVGPDDVGVYLRDEECGVRTMDKVKVHATYQSGAKAVVSDIQTPRMTVTSTRAPEALAKDIIRRILPEATAEAARIRSELDAHEEAARARHAARDQLMAALPHGRWQTEDYEDTSTRIGFTRKGVDGKRQVDRGYGDLRLSNTGDTVSLDIRSLPLRKALEIAAILAED